MNEKNAFAGQHHFGLRNLDGASRRYEGLRQLVELPRGTLEDR